MDRKSIIILVLCFALLLLWSTVIVPTLYPPKHLPPGATNAPPPVAILESNNPAAGSTAAPPVSTGWSQPADTNAPEEILVLTNDSARYTFTSYGGGLKLIELVDYPETVPSWQVRHSRSGRLATLNTQAPVPALALLATPPCKGTASTSWRARHLEFERRPNCPTACGW